MSKATAEQKIADLERALKKHPEGSPEWCDLMLEINRLRFMQPA